MLALTLGTVIALILAVAVVALVALPARRAGRDLLTPRGDEVMTLVRERTGTTIGRTGDLIPSGRAHRENDSASS